MTIGTKYQPAAADLLELRWECFPRRADAAAWLGISERSLRRQEAGAVAVPMPVWLALRLRWGDLGMIDAAWRGWRLVDGQLWGGYRHGFGPGDILAAPWWQQLADHRRRQLDQQQQEDETRCASYSA